MQISKKLISKDSYTNTASAEGTVDGKEGMRSEEDMQESVNSGEDEEKPLVCV